MEIEPSWGKYLGKEETKEYFQNLQLFLKKERDAGKILYPQEKYIFSAFWKTPIASVKVVILGQDPYHGENQAHGLSFSVPAGVKIPPSLQNIYKEIIAEYPETKNNDKFTYGNLSSWAEQGVFLLNATLTVEAGKAGSHQNKGWETFTDTVISTLSSNCEHIVFLLWGAFAQKKSVLINSHKHLVLTAPHPSPLSAYRGFFGCNHFRKTNEYLKKYGKKEIDWGK